MSNVIEILNDSGEVDKTILASEEFAENQFPGKWRLAADQPKKSLGRKISKTAFMQRFGEDQWAELDIMSQHDKAKAKATQLQSAKLRYAKTMVEAVKEGVDLDNPLVRKLVTDACDALQAATIITDSATRASEILDTEVTEEELP